MPLLTKLTVAKATTERPTISRSSRGFSWWYLEIPPYSCYISQIAPLAQRSGDQKSNRNRLHLSAWHRQKVFPVGFSLKLPQPLGAHAWAVSEGASGINPCRITRIKRLARVQLISESVSKSTDIQTSPRELPYKPDCIPRLTSVLIQASHPISFGSKCEGKAAAISKGSFSPHVHMLCFEPIYI